MQQMFLTLIGEVEEVEKEVEVEFDKDWIDPAELIWEEEFEVVIGADPFMMIEGSELDSVGWR